MINPNDFANHTGWFPYTEAERELATQKILDTLNILPYEEEMKLQFMMMLPDGSYIWKVCHADETRNIPEGSGSSP